MHYSKYPRISLKLRAPLELENLLPYDLQYRIYDKNTDQNWKSYLRKGGIMPVHSVELGHLVLLNIDVQDTGEFVLQPFTPMVIYSPYKSLNPVTLQSLPLISIRISTRKID